MRSLFINVLREVEIARDSSKYFLCSEISAEDDN